MLRFFYFLFVSCAVFPLAAQINYAPNVLQAPNLSRAGDGSIGIALGRGQWVDSKELQASYAPHKHIALVANAMLSGQASTKRGEEIGSYLEFWEVGAGIYDTYSKGTISLLAGFGQGSLSSNYGVNLQSNFDLQRWFAQPSVSYRSGFFTGGVGMRFSFLAYPFGETAFDISEYDLKAIRSIDLNNPFFLPELGVQAGVYFRPVSIMAHLTSVFPSMSDLNFAMNTFAFSLIFDWGDLNPQKKQKSQKKRKK